MAFSVILFSPSYLPLALFLTFEAMFVGKKSQIFRTAIENCTELWMEVLSMNPAVNAQINKGEILQAGEHGKETNFTQTQEIGGVRQGDRGKEIQQTKSAGRRCTATPHPIWNFSRCYSIF